MEESKLIITITGIDKVGIVAGFADILAKHQVNIEDIRQTIMQDYFVMIVMADFANANCSFQEFKQSIMKLAEEMDMEVWVQRKKLFDKMHTI